MTANQKHDWLLQLATRNPCVYFLGYFVLDYLSSIVHLFTRINSGVVSFPRFSQNLLTIHHLQVYPCNAYFMNPIHFASYCLNVCKQEANEYNCMSGERRPLHASKTGRSQKEEGGDSCLGRESRSCVILPRQGSEHPRYCRESNFKHVLFAFCTYVLLLKFFKSD